MIHRRRLYWHLFPLFLFVIAVALAGATVYSTTAMEDFLLEQTRAELTAQAYLLSPQLPRTISPEAMPALQQVFITQGRLSGTRLTLVSPSGVVLADSAHRPQEMGNHANRPEIVTALRGETGSAVRYSRTLRKRMMYVALPLQQGDGVVAGVIRTALSLSAIDEKIGAIRLRILLGGIAMAVLAVMLSMVVSRRISRPIEEIILGAKRFAEGERDQPLPIPDTAELADLARTMNQVASEIASQIHQAESRSKEIESILSSMIEGVIAVDMNEKVIRLNAGAYRIFSLDPDTSEGRPLHELIRNTVFQSLLEKCVRTGEKCESDIAFYTPEEQIIYTRYSPLKDAADIQLGALIVMNNVTQLRRLESMRRDFAANVSHEIKTPLTAIKGFVETLRHTDMDDEAAAQRFLEIIEKHVNRLAAIIEDLMQLSRIERDSGGEDLLLQSHPLKEIIRTAVQICSETSEYRNITIDVSGDPHITVMADRPLLEQAAVNLLDNAIKYSASGQQIRIGTQVLANEVQVTISDDGPGIPKKHLPRLFERFYRVDKARSRQMGGTGLGLAIVKHIIQAHGGHISVDSEVNKGSTFTIHLPRQAPAVTPTLQKPEGKQNGS